MSDYSIGQVATAAGIAPSAIRYYEKLGLIPGPRRRSGHRRYSQDVFSRLAVIQLCKQLGFDLSEVKTVVDGLTKGDRSTKKLRQIATEKLPKIDEAIAQAKAMRHLLSLATNCRCPSLEECGRRAKAVGLVAGTVP